MGKILVIDDEAVIREPIAASLRSSGHEVMCVGDARSGMALAKSMRPDLILLDVRMPEVDGIAFLRELRETASTAQVQVLLLSEETEKSVIMQAARHGVKGYILKSAFSLEELLRRVKQLCEPEPVQAAAKKKEEEKGKELTAAAEAKSGEAVKAEDARRRTAK